METKHRLHLLCSASDPPPRLYRYPVTCAESTVKIKVQCVCLRHPVFRTAVYTGAVKVLAAICRGPRKDLRRLAARALGALGWNGQTEV